MKRKNNGSKTEPTGNSRPGKDAKAVNPDRTALAQSIKESIIAELHNRKSKMRFRVL